jgi:hypothetical protein
MNQGQDLRLRSLVMQALFQGSSPHPLGTALVLRTQLPKHIFGLRSSDKAPLVPDINVPGLHNQPRVPTTRVRNVINLPSERGTFIAPPLPKLVLAAEKNQRGRRVAYPQEKHNPVTPPSILKQ